MTRLPYLRRDQLDADGAAVWDALTASRGGAILAEFGAALRFRTTVDRRLLELAIITVGARWRAEFEWWAHARMAREHGVSDAVIDAVGRDEHPHFERDDERVVYATARRLVADGRLDAVTYDEARALLGDRGMVELVSLCGYYTLVSFTLNAFEVPLPSDARPRWSA